uniref:UPF0481 protein n=1 Tax=Noccaea caerulescens TaxID=107243 RepID=A0A1J3HL44_NOCCA
MDPQAQQSTGENSHDPVPTSVVAIRSLISEDIDPKLLRESAGSESCCIVRIPQSLARINHKAYEPKIVSIGPYHHGKEHLKLTQQHKRRFLKFFVAKMEENGIDLQELVKAVSSLEGDIRGSYSEDLALDSQKLVEMMVLDSCFILTLFFVVSGKVVYTNLDDPIFRMPWILPSIRADLLLLENQVPYVLLQTLFETSKLVTCSGGLKETAFEFFDYSLQKPEVFWAKHYNLEAKHLLDLIRKTFVPVPCQRSIKDSYLTILCCSEGKQESSNETSFNDNGFLGFVLSAKKLHTRGIKFKPRKNTDSILDIKFSDGVLHIPPIVMDDFTATVFLNFVAFEQLYADSSNHITSYVAFMACLINEESDAAFLSERRILESYFGTENEVSSFFKSIGKDVALDLEKSYLAKVFLGVNEYSSKGFHVYCAEFVHTHFDSPWTFASSFAALLLLMFAALQVFFAAYSYFRPPNPKGK